MEIGQLVKHIKRGSTYEIIGKTRIIAYDQTDHHRQGSPFVPGDNEEGRFVVVDSIHDGMSWHGIVRNSFKFDNDDAVIRLNLPVLLQKSAELTDAEWVIYRQIDGVKVFARQESEFTPDRFSVL